MTIAYRSQGTIGIGSTTVTPGAPAGLAATDICVIFITTKPDTATINVPAGWTLGVDVAGGGGTTGADVGPTRGAWIWRVGTGAMPSISITSGNSSAALAIAYSSSNGEGFTVAGTSAAYGTGATTTALNVTFGSNPGITAGDWLLVGVTSMSDLPTWSAQTVQATGLTMGTMTERSDVIETTTGNDVGGMVFQRPVTSGTASAAPTATATASSATRGTVGLIRLRENPPAPVWPVSDASSPATIKATTGTTFTTDAFNCPANACIVVGLTSDADTNAGAAPTITDNTGGKFTWTRVASTGHSGVGDVGLAAVFQGVPTNPGVAPGSMTITVTPNNNGSNKPRMIRTTVYTSDAVDISDPIGATTFAAFGASITSISASLTPETDGGGLRMMWLDWNATGVPTTTQANTQVVDSYHNTNLSTNIQLGKTTQTVAGASQTIGANFLSATSDGNYVAYELRGPTTSGPINAAPTAIASGQAMGAPAVTGLLSTSPTAIASAEAHGSPTVTLIPPAISTSPAAIASGLALGSPTVTQQVTLAPTGIASAAVLGNPTVTGLLQVVASSIASQEAHGSPTVSVIPPAIPAQPSGVASAEVMGLPAVQTLLTVGANAIPSGEVVGTPSLSTVLLSVPGGIATGFAAGNHTSTVVLQVSTGGIATALALGNPSVSSISFAVPTGVATAVALGTPVVTTLLTSSPASIGSAIAFGNPTVNVKTNTSPTGIPSGFVSGTPFVNIALSAIPTSIVSAFVAGNPTVTTLLRVEPIGLASAEQFGQPTMLGLLTVTTVGVPSEETFGLPAVTESTYVVVLGIGSTEAFGIPVVEVLDVVAGEPGARMPNTRWSVDGPGSAGFKRRSSTTTMKDMGSTTRRTNGNDGAWITQA